MLSQKNATVNSQILSDMQAQWLKSCPRIAYIHTPTGNGRVNGNRAQDAVSAIRRGDVAKRGELWEVYGQQCTATACGCDDEISPINGIKPCMHVIAVRMVAKLEVNPVLVDLLRAIMAEGGHATEGGTRCRVIVERDYDTEWCQIVAYGYKNARKNILLEDGNRTLEVSYWQVRWALEQLGWLSAGWPEKLRGYEYLWEFTTNGDGGPLTWPMWNGRGHNETMTRRYYEAELASRFVASVGVA